VLLRVIFAAVRDADIADEVAHRGAFGIVTGEGAQGGDAGQLGLAHRDREILLGRDMLGDRHRLVARGLGEIVADPLHLLGRQLQQLGELGDHPLLVLEQVGDEVDAHVAAVDRDRIVVAVDDPAPARRDQPHLDSVLLGHLGVALVLRDRDIAHPPGEHRRDTDLAGGDEEGAAREGRRLRALGDQGRLAEFLHRASRQRSSERISRAAIG